VEGPGVASSVLSTQAAAPTPNRAVATMFASINSSSRNGGNGAHRFEARDAAVHTRHVEGPGVDDEHAPVR
jgi:hypothetical protein